METLRFFPLIERYLMAILYPCSQRDIYNALPSDTGANRPAIRRFGKKGKKNVIYSYGDAQSYGRMADQK